MATLTHWLLKERFHIWDIHWRLLFWGRGLLARFGLLGVASHDSARPEFTVTSLLATLTMKTNMLQA